MPAPGSGFGVVPKGDGTSRPPTSPKIEVGEDLSVSDPSGFGVQSRSQDVRGYAHPSVPVPGAQSLEETKQPNIPVTNENLPGERIFPSGYPAPADGLPPVTPEQLEADYHQFMDNRRADLEQAILQANSSIDPHSDHYSRVLEYELLDHDLNTHVAGYAHRERQGESPTQTMDQVMEEKENVRKMHKLEAEIRENAPDLQLHVRQHSIPRGQSQSVLRGLADKTTGHGTPWMRGSFYSLSPQDQDMLEAIALFTDGAFTKGLRDPHLMAADNQRDSFRGVVSGARFADGSRVQFHPTSRGYVKAHQILRELGASPYEAEDGALFRGMTLPVETIEHLLDGDEFDLQGVSSWTDSRADALDFTAGTRHPGVLFVLEEPKWGTNISRLSNFPRERETVVGGRVQVVSSEMSVHNDVHVIRVTHIGQPESIMKSKDREPGHLDVIEREFQQIMPHQRRNRMDREMARRAQAEEQEESGFGVVTRDSEQEDEEKSLAGVSRHMVQRLAKESVRRRGLQPKPDGVSAKPPVT